MEGGLLFDVLMKSTFASDEKMGSLHVIPAAFSYGRSFHYS
jgi:hypothetical protein